MTAATMTAATMKVVAVEVVLGFKLFTNSSHPSPPRMSTGNLFFVVVLKQRDSTKREA